MALDDSTVDGNESTASTYDGDVSSAPQSFRRGHLSHAHNASDASMTSIPGASSAATAGQSGSGGAASGNVTSQPSSPAPQIPHAPTHRHLSPNSGAATASSIAQRQTKDVPSASHGTGKVGGNSNSNSKEDAAHHPAPHGFLAKMSALDLQESVRQAIDGAGADGVQRNYKINTPATNRPVRIYADGVYDLFHYGHALALRQAKLAFPNVHLLVGVCSDELVKAHKANPVMSSAERYESVRNCRWVDEVIEDAPWVIDQAFLETHKIDYVAHDELPYEGSQPGQSDIYRFVKDLGKFLPTRRTDGVSTSELLQRIVEGYRDGAYDKKLIKIGHPELASNPPSERGSSSRSAHRGEA